MIDKIVASSPEDQDLKGIDLLKLKLNKKETLLNGYTTHRSSLSNMKIEIQFDKNHVPIEMSIFGSPTKYLFGTNANNYNMRDFENSIDKLSNDLNIDLSYYNVYYIEIGANMVVRRSPEVYLSKIIGHKENTIKKSIINDYETVYLENKIRKNLTLYNKTKEAKNKIPIELKNKNVLRYELKYKKKIHETLKMHLTIGKLYTAEVYNDLLTRWRNEFNNILFIHKNTFDGRPNIENLRPFLISEGIRSVGYDSMVITMNDQFKKNGITGTLKARPLNWLKSNARVNRGGNYLLKELERKVNRIYQSNLQF